MSEALITKFITIYCEIYGVQLEKNKAESIARKVVDFYYAKLILESKEATAMEE
jgi:hypothetical protein